jgi:hypothetical protein
MSKKPGLYERVDAEIVAGRLWRAKEILQSQISQAGYDCYLFERYARLLDRLGDKVEAGRFFFLSGKRSPESEEAISIYLGRHTRNGLKGLLGTFPRAARLKRLEQYPDVVRQKLEELDASDEALEQFKHGRWGAALEPVGFVGRCASIGCCASFMIALVCFGWGVYEALEALARLCRYMFG